jgi:hypothetical protein
MDPKKDAFRRCIAPCAWPELDRRAWANCLTPGDLLEASGAGASWAPHTRAKIAKGYGRWLTWLITKHLLDPAIAPGDRVNRQRVPEALRQYQRRILELRRRHTGLNQEV